MNQARQDSKLAGEPKKIQEKLRNGPQGRETRKRRLKVSLGASKCYKNFKNASNWASGSWNKQQNLNWGLTAKNQVKNVPNWLHISPHKLLQNRFSINFEEEKNLDSPASP